MGPTLRLVANVLSRLIYGSPLPTKDGAWAPFPSKEVLVEQSPRLEASLGGRMGGVSLS